MGSTVVLNRHWAGIMEQQLRLDFANLPLIEAVARFTFEQPIELTYGLINGLAESLRSSFPQLAELDAIETPPGVHPPLDIGYPKPPGAVYRGGSSGISLTLQSQMLAARWLKQVAPSAPPYPRFAAVENALITAYRNLRLLAHDQGLSVSVVNMVYANLVSPEKPETVLQDYFTRKAQVGLLESAHSIHEVVFSWREADSIDLRMHLQAATAQIGDRQHTGFRLATAGGERLVQGDDPYNALQRIHNRLQFFFRDLLSARAKAEWGLKEST